VGLSLSRQALLLAKHNDRIYGELRNVTKALVFFATPHRGGNGTTIGQIAVNAVRFFSGNLHNNLVASLKKSSKYLAQLSADFSHQYEDYDFLSVVETRGMMRAPLRTVVVDPDSAIIGLAGHREQVLELDKDHSQLCKLAEGSDFNRVARHLKRLANSAIRSPASRNQEHDAGQEDSGPGPAGGSITQMECGYCVYEMATLRFLPCEHTFCDDCSNVKACPSCGRLVMARTRFANSMSSPGR